MQVECGLKEDISFRTWESANISFRVLEWWQGLAKLVEEFMHYNIAIILMK